jgi:phosphate transport system protein
MNEHIVKAYDDDLASLRTMLAEMGGLAEDQLAKAMDSLTKRDQRLADTVIQQDERLDQLEIEVEERAIRTIAKRQPMALDLREIMASIRISSDLERIGDLAKNIAKRTHAVADLLPQRMTKGMVRMAQLAQGQLKLVLDSLAAKDTGRAMEVWRRDEDIDALYNSIFRELLTYMMEDPRMIGACTHLLFAAKNIERIGDHATNIAENVHYLVHGAPIRDDRPKKDTTSMTPVTVK